MLGIWYSTASTCTGTSGKGLIDKRVDGVDNLVLSSIVIPNLQFIHNEEQCHMVIMKVQNILVKVDI